MSFEYQMNFILNYFSTFSLKNEKELIEIITDLKKENEKNIQSIAFEKLKRMAQEPQSKMLENANVLLGFCYYYGVGVNRNFELAIETLNKIKDNRVAQYFLANIFALGNQKIKRDLEQAIFLYERSASKGFPCSQYKLGCLYFFELGVKKNDEKALDYFKKAAFQNYLFAYLYLGLLYEQGRGYHKDTKLAFEHYQKATKDFNETFIDTI